MDTILVIPFVRQVIAVLVFVILLGLAVFVVRLAVTQVLADIIIFLRRRRW